MLIKSFIYNKIYVYSCCFNYIRKVTERQDFYILI